MCKISQKKREMRKMMMKKKRMKKRKKRRKRKILKKVKLHRGTNIIISISIAMVMMIVETAVKMKIVMKQETHEETLIVAVKTSKRKRTTNKQLKILKRRKNMKRNSPSPSSNHLRKSPRSYISASTK